MDQNLKPFFYKSSVRKLCWRLLILFCILPVIYEFLFVKRYSYFAKSGFESIDGAVTFYALIGLFGSLAFIIISKAIGYFLKVGETYYNDDY